MDKKCFDCLNCINYLNCLNYINCSNCLNEWFGWKKLIIPPPEPLELNPLLDRAASPSQGKLQHAQGQHRPPRNSFYNAKLIGPVLESQHSLPLLKSGRSSATSTVGWSNMIGLPKTLNSGRMKSRGALKLSLPPEPLELNPLLDHAASPS